MVSRVRQSDGLKILKLLFPYIQHKKTFLTTLLRFSAAEMRFFGYNFHRGLF